MYMLSFSFLEEGIHSFAGKWKGILLEKKSENVSYKEAWPNNLIKTQHTAYKNSLNCCNVWKRPTSALPWQWQWFFSSHQARMSLNHLSHHCQIHHNIAPLWCSCSPAKIITVSLTPSEYTLKCLFWQRKLSILIPNVFFSLIF